MALIMYTSFLLSSQASCGSTNTGTQFRKCLRVIFVIQMPGFKSQFWCPLAANTEKSLQHLGLSVLFCEMRVSKLIKTKITKPESWW